MASAVLTDNIPLMNSESLTFVFSGPAVESGEIDVQDLAPALLAIGALVQAANSELNGDRAQIAVKVKATAVGSFEVNVTVVQSVLEQAKALFDFANANKDGIAAVNDLADLIFKGTTAAGGLGGGLFALLKWLRGRKPEKITVSAGDVQVHIGDTVFVTNYGTIQLAESVAVREQARKVVSTISGNGIESLRVRRGDETLSEVQRSEAQFFELLDEEETLADEVRTMTLQIISLSFKEDNKWRVTDGGESFGATINDDAFLTRIANNDIAFAKGDYLICEVREVQHRGPRGLQKERTIERVIDHKPAARQLRLL
jgi:hypothetical protein